MSRCGGHVFYSVWQSQQSLNIYVIAVTGSAGSMQHSDWTVVYAQCGARFVRLIHASRVSLLLLTV